MRIIYPFIRFFVFALVLLQFGACSKASFVSEEASGSVKINLTFNTSEPIFDVYSASGDEIKIRYIIRAYAMENNKVAKVHSKEIRFSCNITEGYNRDFTIDLESGSYKLMAWSDLLVNGKPLHDADDFGDISLTGVHLGSSFYRETYRGECNFTISGSSSPSSLNVNMIRPQASFELVATDLVDFIRNNSTKGGDISLDDYTVVFNYVGFVPTAYSMYTDKPSDSSTGIVFNSSLSKLNDFEASLGFDYVFVNDKDSVITVRVGILDSEGKVISLSETIKVPLKRCCHTVLQGRYLTKEPKGGIEVDVDFNGNYTLII